MRSQHGSTVPNAHLVLLFQRICKLLYYRIKPIFVFDGGVPELKKKTMVKLFFEKEVQAVFNAPNFLIRVIKQEN